MIMPELSIISIEGGAQSASSDEREGFLADRGEWRFRHCYFKKVFIDKEE